MEALIIDPARLISDIIGYITELRTTYQSSQQPLTDDETTLHKFCVKLETVLRHEQKEKYSLLGVRKDYWNFIQECISRDDGVKHVQVLPQVRTSQGKGRAFIRYSLVKNSLADAIQRCLVRKNHLSQWYRSDAILCHPSLSTALINKLYDLNGIEFDLPCAGNELDISWPAFSRRSFVDGQSSVLGRRSSIGSMTSADFRNDRPDPLLGLASEVSSLKAVFPDERFHGQADDDTEVFDDVSIPDSAVEAPNVTEITLEISHLHQRILSWKADLESKLTKATIDVKKAHDDRKFAVQEYELKLKQLNEKYSNLTRSAADNSNAKVKELCARLTTAEEALSEREAEIQQLRREVTLAVSSSQDAQRSAIDLERQLVVSERQRSELSAECEQLGEKLKDKEYVTEELKSNLSKQKEKFNQLELMDTVSNKNIAELEGELKAKSVALQRIQESFEKVNGMVFGSFEELELELKARLTGTERDLENQREENRRLARNIVDVERQNRELVCKFTETTDKVEELENNNGMLQNTIGDFQKQLSVLKKEYSVFLSDLFETLSPAGGHDEGDGDYVEKETNRVVSKVKHLVVQVSCLHQQIDEKSIQEKQLAEHLEELEASIVKKDVEMKALNEEVDSSKKRVEFINKEKKFLEKEKLEADNKVIVLEKSEQTLRSDFSLAMQEKCKALDELSYLKEQSLLKTGVDDELCALRQQLDETVKAKEKLTTDLQNITETLEIIESEKKSLDEQLKALKENMAACQDDKVSLEHELDVTKQQLEVANEARIRAEQGQVKMQEQLEGLRCMMDQEIAALKFQLSSEAIKYETELKVLSDKTQEYTNVKDRLSELQELVVDLEARLQERNDVIQHDKQKYVSEIKHLRNEVQHCKSGFDGNKLKLRALENELLLTTKQLEEERSRQKDLKRWAEEFEVEKGLANQQYEDKIAELQADTEDLKERLVQVTREKAELWAKAHDMEHEIKVKSDDRWMDDSEVTHCLECKTEFSFLLRKHHCRVCGRIFCHGCSNNWVQTPHSRKLRRVCNHCLSADKRLLLQLVGSARETEDDAKSDINVDSLQRSESLLSAGDGSEREGLAIEENTTDGFPQPQPAPSTSTAGQPKSRSSSSTFTRPFGKREKSEKEQSVASSDSAKYTSFKTVKSSKRKTSKSSEQPLSRSPEECEYEFVDPEEEETDEQPGARVVISDSDNKADLVIPTVNQEPGEFWHVTVPPGRRHVFQVLVATPRASLHWMFTSEKKSILFGVAYKLTETKNDQESETVVPMTRSDSHLHSVKGHLDNVSAGIYLLVFDNTFSRMTSKRLFCMVRVQRKEDDEEQDSFT